MRPLNSKGTRFQRRKEYYEKHPEVLERRIQYLKKYKKKNRKRITEKVKKWQKRRSPKQKRKAQERNNKWRREHYRNDSKFREYMDLRNLKNRIRIRNEILSFLGSKCIYCGFSDPRALCVDHVLGGGRKDRIENHLHGRKSLFEDIKKNPKKYQLLCSNCNTIKRYENGEFKYRDNKTKKKTLKIRGGGH